MTTTLRVVLDQPAPVFEPDVASAARELALALAATAPSGCEVRALAPSDADGEALAAMSGIAGVDRMPLSQAAVAEFWRRGLRVGARDGLVHSASLAAPLVKHDREYDNDQTVVTVWDLDAWDAPDSLPKGVAAWTRAMLRRAVKHADAVVVPTHHLAARLAEIAPLGERIRVIAGAPQSALRVPGDEVGRRRELDLPEGYVLTAAPRGGAERLRTVFEAVSASERQTPVVVLDAADGAEPAIIDAASAAGIPERRVHVRGRLEVHDRAAAYGGAIAYVAPDLASAFPWRVLDALRLGVPTVAADTETHRELLLDAAAFAPAVDAAALGAALADTLASTAAVERLSVLAADRGRAFSWTGAAERVWQLHADL